MSRSFALVLAVLFNVSGVIIAICGANPFTVSSSSWRFCFSSAHVSTAVLHPFRDSRSQKWLSAPGMCTVLNVYDRRYSAHRRSLSLAATDIADTRVGPSSMYVSDLWSLTDANGMFPISKCLCLSTALRMGYASLHDMFQFT